MALPKQVQQGLKDLEAIENEIKAQTEAQNQPPEDTKDKQPDVPKAEDPPKVEDKKPAEPEVTPVKDDFEQKYNTLRGKYDAEVPRLHQQLKDVVQEVTDLKDQLAKAKETPPEPEEPLRLITDEDKESFGEDLINVARKAAKEELDVAYKELFSKQQEQIADLREQLQNTGNQVTELTFEQRLAQVVPDFMDINRDPKWIAWLGEHDPMSRGPRRLMAQKALNEGDVDAIADYVKMFKETLEQADPKKEERKEELERQLTPESRGSTTPSEDSGKPVYTKKQADAVWTEIRQLNSKGDFDKASQLEATISQAYIEGRVQLG